VNGNQVRPAPACLPSIFTTARAAPLFSIVTFSMALSNDSDVTTPSPDPARSCRSRISLPSRSSSRPSRWIDAITAAPPRGTRQMNEPVSISIADSVSRTERSRARFAFRAATTSKGPLPTSAPGTSA
jgi:hypothetical protein